MRKALFIGQVWPEPTSSAAGWRMLQLIQLFLEEYEVHFACAAAKSIYSYNLTELGVIDECIQLNDDSFDQYLEKVNPQVVLFDRFMVEEQYGWRVARTCPDSLRILDTEDLHFLRAARSKVYLKKDEQNDLHNDTAKREIAAIYRSDISLIISEKEVQILREDFNVPEHILYYLPFLENKLEEAHVHSLKTFEARQHVVFIGNFIHEPNWKTVEILKRDIWPILRKKLPKVELHIYGAYASQKVTDLNKPEEGFMIKGRADDARNVLENYRVLVAPIPFGAGVKGKFVDAMSCGTPSVSSTVGVEGMVYEGVWNGLVEDDVEAFVDAVVKLYLDKEMWQDAQSVGFRLFNQRYTNKDVGTNFLILCQGLEKQVEKHRSGNFIGQMLMHHTAQSTKYMSLWISEKNKRRKE